MAYAEFGAFRPSESAYYSPGEYETTQRNIALEKASYLSTMDQFYADLEERGREFDLTLGFEKEKFEGTLGEQKREFDLGQSQEYKMFGETLGFEKEKQGFEEDAWLKEFQESIREFGIQSDLKQQEINLGNKAQTAKERNDTFGQVYGGVAAVDIIGEWFDWW